jgi:hypothetical protein
MSAGILPLLIEQGATFFKSMVWKINASPVNLTGYSARMQARANNLADPMISLTSAQNGGLTLDSATGRISIYISAQATAGLHAGKHKYDLELVAPDGFVTRLVKGEFKVTQEQTE